MPVTKHVADMVAEAQAMIPRVSPEEAAAMQASGEAVLVDIRDVRSPPYTTLLGMHTCSLPRGYSRVEVALILYHVF